MTDHTRAALEGYGVVFEARRAWMANPTPANKARFDAAFRDYQSRFDCSCPTEGPKVCVCEYTPAPHSDASATTTNFDSGEPHMSTFDDYLKQAGGDFARANQLAWEADRRRKRDADVPALRSDALDRAEDERRIRNATAWTQPLSHTTESPKDAQRRAAVVTERIRRADAADAERRAFRADAESARFDGAAPKCECGNFLIEGNNGYSAKCGECSERAFKRRQQNQWRKPLQATNTRSAGTIGTHPTDDYDGAA